jgi:catechol 2,3-dioxygenase-like lactoylglutathione lyase family enzyme
MTRKLAIGHDECMQLIGVHHVAICVPDVDAALGFYVDTLGCEARADRPDFGFPGAWLDAGSQQIHLMQLAGTPAPLQHFALQVADLDAAVAELESRGVDVRRAEHTQGAGFQAFLKDPGGNEIELNQPDH